MSNKISEWKQAKDLCENIAHLNETEKLEYIDKTDFSQSVKQKAISLIKKFNENFELLESGGLEKVLPKIKVKANLVGKHIDNYLLTKVLGTGGMSTVYLARRIDSDIQKEVAVKILSPYATADKYLELFNREQKSLAQLNHNNIVSLHHGGQTEDGTNYLVMDYVEAARDVIQYARETELDFIGKIQLIKSIADTIAYAHDKNIIHRDLKSANILIDSNNQVKIVDFGIALFAEDSNSDNSTRVFTLDIASPEQIQGNKVDLRTDVFSLGALLLQLVTNKSPTPKVKPNQYNPNKVKTHISKILKQSTVNTDFKNIIQTAMHIDVKKRYPNMKEFAKDLNNLLQHQPVNASSDSSFYRTKKLIQRNPIISALFLIIITISLFAGITIYNNISKRQFAEEKNSRSMAIIDALFEQANPFKSKQNSAELIKTLENIKNNQQQLLDSDPEFKYIFYLKMSKVYDSNSLFAQALEAKNTAYEVLLTFAPADDLRLLEREAEIMNLLHATGEYQRAIDNAENFLLKLKQLPVANTELTLATYILLSKTYAELNQLDEAINIGELAKIYMQNNVNIDLELQARMFNSIAVVQRTSGNMEVAGKYYLQAINILRKIKDGEKRLSTVLRNYAIFKGRSGDFIASERFFLESIDIVKAVDLDHPDIGVSYLQYSTLLSLTNRVDEAQIIVGKALDIFKLANNELQISNAHKKLANYALVKVNIASFIENIIASKKIIHKTYGLDHPKTLYLYNLSLWMLMLDPYKDYAKQVINHLDNFDYVYAIGSSEYSNYQLQKSLLNGHVVYDNSYSILSQYLYGDELKTDEQKINWLQNQINLSEKRPAVVKSLLHLWLLEFKPNQTEYSNHCLTNSTWIDTTRLVFKIDIIQRCINISTKNGYQTPERFKEIIEGLKLQAEQNKAAIENLVRELINSTTMD